MDWGNWAIAFSCKARSLAESATKGITCDFGLAGIAWACLVFSGDVLLLMANTAAPPSKIHKAVVVAIEIKFCLCTIVRP